MYFSFSTTLSIKGFNFSFSLSESLEIVVSSFLIKFSIESPSTLAKLIFSLLVSNFCIKCPIIGESNNKTV